MRARAVQMKGKSSPVVRGVAKSGTAKAMTTETEEYICTLLNDSFSAVALMNSDGIVRYHNPYAEHISGFKATELIGKDWHEFFHPEDLAHLHGAIESLINKPGQSMPIKCRFMRKDSSMRVLEGTITNLLDNPIVNAIVINYQDVTDREWLEKAVHELNKRYHLLANNITDAIFFLTMNLEVVYISPSVTRLHGYTVEELMDMDNMKKMCSPAWKEIEAFWSEIFTHLTSENAEQTWSVSAELELNHKDGHNFWIEAKATLVYDPDLQMPCVVGVARDITQRKEMEQQLRRTERLAAVGQLAAGVAHELNNPLAAVQAYSQFLSSRQDLDESMREDVDTIYKEAQRASKITANLLQFCRKHEPEKKLISINEVIEDSIELNAYRLKVNNIEMSTNLDPELPQTMADFFQLQQVFVNLITNAEQAMTKAHGQGTLTITSSLAKGAIRVTFADSGPGIPDDALNKVFDPFFTTKDVGEGTGLGLSICFGIVEHHGGTIRVKSEDGKGSTFTIELPVVTADEVATDRSDLIQIEQA